MEVIGKRVDKSATGGQLLAKAKSKADSQLPIADYQMTPQSSTNKSPLSITAIRESYHGKP